MAGWEANAQGKPDPFFTVVAERPVPGPFTGKCIHGVPGARFERGALTNDACGHCQATKAASERR